MPEVTERDGFTTEAPPDEAATKSFSCSEVAIAPRQVGEVLVPFDFHAK
jgi:hypothetical protein